MAILVVSVIAVTAGAGSVAAITASSPCGIGPGAPGNCLVALSFVNTQDGFGIYRPIAVMGLLAPPFYIVTTENGGRTWREIARSPLQSSSYPLTELQFINRNDGFAYDESGQEPGLFATQDGGRTWKAVLSRRVGDVASRGPDVWVADTSCPVSPSTAPCRVGLERSTDEGKRWTPVPLPEEAFRVASVALGTGDTAFLGVWSSSRAPYLPGDLLVSENDGTTWARHPFPCPPGYQLGGSLSIASKTLWMICRGQGSGGTRGLVLYRSGDGGATWTPESSQQLGPPTGVRPGAPGGKLEALVATSATNAVALDQNGGLVASTDGGVTWHTLASAAMERAINGLTGTLDVLSPTHLWAAASEVIPFSRGLWASADAGRTWEALSPAPPRS